jgi:hypothetical protein
VTRDNFILRHPSWKLIIVLGQLNLTEFKKGDSESLSSYVLYEDRESVVTVNPEKVYPNK